MTSSGELSAASAPIAAPPQPPCSPADSINCVAPVGTQREKPRRDHTSARRKARHGGYNNLPSVRSTPPWR